MIRRLTVNGDVMWIDSSDEDPGLACVLPSLAVDSLREESDINTIVRRFGLTGRMPSDIRLPTYQNFLDAPDDYRGALDAIRAADASFNRLPAAVRARFENDPAQFVDFCSDPANLPALQEMGLAPKPVRVAEADPEPPAK